MAEPRIWTLRGKGVIEQDRDGLVRLFTARHEFPNQWQRFLHPGSSAEQHKLEFELTRQRFPYLHTGKTITVTRLALLVKLADGVSYSGGSLFELKKDGLALASDVELVFDPGLNMPSATPLENGLEEVTDTPGIWNIELQQSDLLSGVKDIFLVCTYSTAG